MHPVQPWVSQVQELRSKALPMRGRPGHSELSSCQKHEVCLSPVIGLAPRAMALAGQQTAPHAGPVWDSLPQHPQPCAHMPQASDPSVP